MRFDVLVVDDDPDTRANLRDILEMDGYAVESVGTAAAALARDDLARFGAVILDRRLPDVNAEGVLPRLRELAPDAAVLVVTGYADVQGAIAAFRLGAEDYVLKPIDPDDLRARLGRLAERRQSREELRAANAAREAALADLKARTEELRQTTQQLWQAARLAGVGELAASIAHELNNPLATVSLRVEGLLAKTPPDDPRRKALEIVDQEVDRMGRLVANLLNFSRAGREEVSIVNVADEITKTVELTGYHFRQRGVVVASEFGRGVPAIQADRQQLRQVFLNLFTNAADAMPRGGRLVPRVKAGELAPGRPAVVIEVADTGTGIPSELLPRVTEPFFTTKEEGKGTGLGLAICRRIVEQHHGRLEVESELGKGTTIRVLLPAQNGENLTGPRTGD